MGRITLEQCLSLERRVWDALVTGDADADRELLADDFVGVYPTGFAGRDEHSGQLAAGPTVARYTIDAATLIPVGDDTKRLKAFLAAVARRADLRTAFGEVLARLAEAVADGDNPDLACATLVLDSLETIVRSGVQTTLPFSAHPWVLLAEAWYGTFLPSIDVRPKYRTRQEVEDAVAVFHASGEVTIDELAELVDINLNDFEHSITFGNRPLFTPPVYVDTAALRAIGTLQPWFRQLQDIRFGGPAFGATFRF